MSQQQAAKSKNKNSGREEIKAPIASKLPGIGESIFAIMSKLAHDYQAINLSQGFPDFNCPDELINLVNKYMKEGKNQYSPMPGIMPLKEKLAAKTEELYGANYDPDKEITVSAGAAQAIFTSIAALIKEGDEVIVFEPAYDSYVPSILLNKGIPKYVELDPPEYKINWEEVKRNITVHTKMIIINSPHNPTGTILTQEDMKQLIKIVSNYDIFVLSDEVYEHIIFDGERHESITRYPELKSKSMAVFSFGKTYHTTGWKMGYILAPEEITKEFRKIFQFNMFCVSTPMQYAYADFLDNKEHYLELGAFYQKKRDFFLDILKDSKFEVVPCKGTYFQCVNFSKISDKKDVEFARELTMNHKVAAIPTSVFNHLKNDHSILRFCFAKEEETLKRAGDILCKI